MPQVLLCVAAYNPKKSIIHKLAYVKTERVTLFISKYDLEDDTLFEMPNFSLPKWYVHSNQAITHVLMRASALWRCVLNVALRLQLFWCCLWATDCFYFTIYLGYWGLWDYRRTYTLRPMLCWMTDYTQPGEASTPSSQNYFTDWGFIWPPYWFAICYEADIDNACRARFVVAWLILLDFII